MSGPRIGFFSLAAALILAAAQGAFAKNSGKFSDFAGTYNGMAAIFYETETVPAIASASFKPSRDGDSAVITISGMLSSQGERIPFQNTFALAENGTLTIADIFYQIAGETRSASGAYRIRKNTIHYTIVLPDDPGAVIEGTISIQLKASKPRLLLTLTLSENGRIYYNFPFELARSGRKK